MIKNLIFKMTQKDLNFLKNAMAQRQCFNCARSKDCEREHPNTYEPIGTCDKWEDKNGLRTLID